MSKSILVTGGAGFIGSNFLSYFYETYPDYRLVNLDKMTYAADASNLDEFSESERYKFIKDDICKPQVINKIFAEENISGVIHFAAESHVDNSIENPDSFINTNIIGTFNLIEAARNTWMSDKAFTPKEEYKDARFLHISTDEVYGSLGDEGLFTEETPYAPNSPYSASKASSDFLVRSYFHTYGLNVVTTNCSNNYGPRQHKEKLIPTIIRKSLSGENIPIYGNGKNVRDWLFVKDHCTAISTAFHKGKSGETYNIGGSCELTNIEICNVICELLDTISPKESGSYKDQISFVTDRQGHDWRYAIDTAKIESELQWKPQMEFRKGLEETIHWYIKKLS